MESKVNYDRLAFAYDRLADLIFGDSIQRSKETFFEKIPEGATILVLGGGTGSFLPLLLKTSPTRNVVFIDSSNKMIRRARERMKNDPRVKFIHGTHLDIPKEVKAYVVIAHFFLDLFDDQNLATCIRSIGSHTTDDALWIVSDFVQPRKWSQKLLLKTMYFFFRLATGMTTRSLPAWEQTMLAAGFAEVERKGFSDEFIQSILFRRQ